MSAPPTFWLEKKNREYGDGHMPHGQRPWQAWIDWGQESGYYTALGHPDVRAIFDWFALQSPEGAQRIGPAYVGVYYFDGAVWPLVVPIVFGVGQLNALDMLKTMPPRFLDRLKSSQVRLNDLAGITHDCVDYALQFRDNLNRPTLSAFSRDLLGASDRKLCSAVELLLARRPSSDVSEAAAFAVELALKGLLSIVDGLDERGARELSHNIPNILKKAADATGDQDLAELLPSVSLLPATSQRYASTTAALFELWRAYAFAQRCSAVITRRLFGTAIMG